MDVSSSGVSAWLYALALEAVNDANLVARRDNLEACNVVHQTVVARQALQRRVQVGSRADGVVEHIEDPGAYGRRSVQPEQRIPRAFGCKIPQPHLHGQGHARFGIPQPICLEPAIGHQLPGVDTHRCRHLDNHLADTGGDLRNAVSDGHGRGL